MKWMIAIFVAIILFIIVISSMSVFSSFMAKKAEIWEADNIVIPITSKIALWISLIWRRYFYIISNQSIIRSYKCFFRFV